MKIFTELVISKETGEVSSRDYTEIFPKKKLKGGFNIVYMNEYEKASSNVVFSNLDFRLLSQIRSLFKKTQTEVKIPVTKLAKKNDTTRQTVSSIVARMVKADMLYRIERGLYRFNPNMFIPFGANVELLQKEWKSLKELEDEQ